MYKGAVFFDYDGTLVNENEDIFAPTEKTNEALELLRRNGYATFLATGRMKPITTLVSGKFTGLITSNGACVEVEGKKIRDICFDTELQLEAINYMKKHDIGFALETSICGYSNSLNKAHFLNMLEHFKIPKGVFRELKDESIKSNKMMITYDSETKVLDMIKHFEGRLKIIPHRYCLSGDMDTYANSKAEGIRAVLKELGIDRDMTYAFGDGKNDLDMFECVGHAVAMGDHSSSLDSVTEFVTKKVSEEGVFFALKEFYNLI